MSARRCAPLEPVRLAGSRDAAEWAARIERGLVRIATVTRLEVGYSARSGADLRAGLQRPPLSVMPVEYQTPAIEGRAVEVLTLLADRGQAFDHIVGVPKPHDNNRDLDVGQHSG